MNKKVTVITPTYHRLASLKEAIECVRRQTYQNWEHLIISDGSDARVKSLVKSFQDQRIVYLHTFRTNNWGHSQRNWGLRFARGQYLMCLDDDNLIYDQYLERMFTAFDSEKIGYVVCQINYLGGKILSPKLPLESSSIDHLNFMIKTALVRKVGGWANHYEADFAMIKNISEISAGNFINDVLGTYRRLKGEPSGNNKSQIKGNPYICFIRWIKQIIYWQLVRFYVRS